MALAKPATPSDGKNCLREKMKIIKGARNLLRPIVGTQPCFLASDPEAAAQPRRRGRDALERKAPQRRLDRRLEEVAKAVGGGDCRLQKCR